MPFLEIVHLDKHYGANHVVRDFNLAIDKGEFVSFLGPSGCGKTTTLRMVAGFEFPDTGSIRIDGKDVVDLKPNQRNIGMVFQAYALFPNMTVAQNVAFGLRIAGMPRADSDRRVAEMLTLISLPDLGARYPFQLSGGSSSASPSPAPSRRGPRSSSSTSRSPPSTPRSASRSATRSAPSRRNSASPPSTSPTTRRRRCRCPTGSWS